MTFRLFELQITRGCFILNICGIDFERGGYASLLYIQRTKYGPPEFEILWTHPLISWWRWERKQ